MAVNQRVSVTRAFRVGGEDLGIGSVINIDLPTAIELRTARKVQFVPNDTPLAKKPLVKVERAKRGGNQEISALAAQVAVLTALVEKLTQPPQKAGAKEKANA